MARSVSKAAATTVIYHNPKCSTSRKTLDLLRDSGLQPTIVEYLKTPPSRDESPASGWGHLPLAGEYPQLRMIRDAGIDVRAAVRKREPLYAELNLGDAADDELLDALARHPILIERPFVVTSKGTRLARPVDAVREIL
jgi:arsenate reductase (glutaredoxin)